MPKQAKYAKLKNRFQPDKKLEGLRWTSLLRLRISDFPILKTMELFYLDMFRNLVSLDKVVSQGNYLQPLDLCLEARLTFWIKPLQTVG